MVVLCLCDDVWSMIVSECIIVEVIVWPGVILEYGCCGELFFKVVCKEIGYLYGDYSVYFGFLCEMFIELHEAGCVIYYLVFLGKDGLAVWCINGDDDVREVIVLLWLNYERVVMM